MKKLRVWVLILCLLLPAAAGAPCEAKKTNKTDLDWPEGPSLVSESAVLMEVSTGTVLYQKNSHQKNYPASITKIMTVLLCLENSDMNETVTFSKDAIYGIERDSSHIGLKVGEQLTMEQTLYAIMLESANEAALGAAEHVSGSVAGFADMMNQKAVSLGCKDTNFTNPNGLHNDDHYTSAMDMALISRAAIQNNAFRRIADTKHYTVPTTNVTDVERPLNNHHEMVYGHKHPQYETDYVIGGKTGYTTKAGNTLVTFARKDGMELVAVVMRSKGPGSAGYTIEPNEYTDTLDLFNYGYTNFKLYNPATMDEPETTDADNILFNRFNPLFSGTDSPIRFQDSSNIVLPEGADVNQVKKTVSIAQNPVAENGETILGSVSYTYGKRKVGGSNVIYVKSDAPRLVTDKPIAKVAVEELEDPLKERNLKPFIILGIFAGIIMIAALIYFLLYRPRHMSQFSFARRRRRGREKQGKDLINFKL